QDFRGAPALAVADTGHHRIVITTLEGVVLDVIGAGVQGMGDGTFEKARFNAPQGLAVKGKLLYIADTQNHQLRVADLEARSVETLAGDGQQGHSYRAQNVPGDRVSLASPWDVAFYPDDTHLVVAMAGLHQLWVYDTKAESISVLAGSGTEGLQDGAAATAQLAQPSGLSAYDGKLYFVDAESSALRVLEKGKIKTLVGEGLFEFGFTDGGKDVARMQHPLGVWAGKDGVFVADAYNHAIRRYDTQTQKLSTFAGNVRGLKDGTVEEAQFNEPGGITSDGSVLLVADTNNRDVRALDMARKRVTSLRAQEEKAKQAVAILTEMPNPMELKKDLNLLQGQPVTFTLKMQRGWHINPDAPSYLALFDLVQNNQPVAVFERAQLQNGMVTIPPRMGVQYRMQGIFYYCEDKPDALCLIKSLDAPVAFFEDGAAEYEIELN
ncbi:MAG: hypothetical protein K2Q01_12310, partial [Rickettsiales bacterium]|nr:hypothetical protein [Rickettsiales bacterium]